MTHRDRFGRSWVQQFLREARYAPTLDSAWRALQLALEGAETMSSPQYRDAYRHACLHVWRHTIRADRAD